MPSCFISHTWREGEHHFAMRLAEVLERKKIKVWVDEEQIPPGTHIKEAIRKGVNHDSDTFLFVMSPEALKSDMCRYELNLALNQMEEYGKPIIPVLFEECEIPDFLRNICYADFRNSLYFDAALERLVKGIKRSAGIRQICVELSHPDPEKRIEISEKLRGLKNPLALGPLKNRLLSEEFDPTVKYWLAIAIGEIGSGKAVEILGKAMGETDCFARLGVIEAMIEAFESLDKEVLTQALKVLSEAINSDNPNKRLCAVKILVGLRRKSDQIESMLWNLKNDPDNNIRSTVKEYFKGKGGCYENARV